MVSQLPSDALTARQYLIWALEFTEKAGNREASKHARLALVALEIEALDAEVSLRVRSIIDERSSHSANGNRNA